MQDAAVAPPPHQRPHRRLQASLDQLRRFHAAGRASLESHPHRLAYGAAASARVLGFAGEMLRKARAFADERTGYTEAEVERLLAACQAAGYAIGVSHVIKLLSVTTPDGQADRRRRLALQTAAIRERWSRRRLEEEIRQRVGARRPLAGRRVRPPRDAGDARHKLALFCGQWRRISIAVARAAADDPRGRTDLSDDIRRAVGAVDAAVRRLNAALCTPAGSRRNRNLRRPPATE
jgi:hypothetical protein